MPVRRRNDCLPAAEGVRKCTGRNLPSVEIRSNVNVRRIKILHKLFALDEAIVEDHVFCDTQFLGEPLQIHPIGLALLTQESRMGRSEHNVDKVRKDLQYLRKGANNGGASTAEPTLDKTTT